MAAVVSPGTPAAGTNGAAPPPAAGDFDAGKGTSVADPGGDGEGELIQKALAELNGDEAPPEKEVSKPVAAPPPPKEELDEGKLSAGFAKLRSEEKRYAKRKEEQNAAHLAREAEYKAKVEAFEAEQKEFRSAREGAKGSPLAALKALGWTYDQLVEYVAKEGVIPTEKLRSDFKLELDEAAKASKAELEGIQKELREQKAERERQESQRLANDYEQRVFSEIDGLIGSEAQKFPNLARVPKEKRDRAVLSHMVTHYQENGEALAISDAMLYMEKEASEYASWFQAREVARQEGAVKSANPGAAKPETEARPIPQREASTRGVHKVDPDAMSEEEREAEALRILAGGED